jgi:hypothetical protein
MKTYLFLLLCICKMMVRGRQGEAEMTVVSVFVVCSSIVGIVSYKDIGWGEGPEFFQLE